MEKRRKNPRIDIALPIEYSLPQRTKKILYTVSKNVGLGGIEILCDDFLSWGQTLRTQINLIDTIAHTRTEVVWCQKEMHSERYRIGLKFLELKEKDKARLCGFIDGIYQSIEMWARKMKKKSYPEA